MKLFSLIVVPITLLAINLQAAITTILNTSTSQTNTLVVQDYEAVRVLSMGKKMGVHGFSSGYYLSKSGITLVEQSIYFSVSQIVSATPATTPVVIAGPAEIVFYTVPAFPYETNQPAAAWLTLEITPEPFEVGRTITIAPGVGGANVTLECSTNLVNWTEGTNGVYTNMNEAKFFRIKADRIR